MASPSVAAIAKHELYRNEARQDSSETVMTWWRRLQRLGITAFGDLSTWTEDQQDVAFNCLIDGSKEKKAKRGKPARVNYVTPAPAVPKPNPKPAVVNAMSTAHSGSAVRSVHSTASEAALKGASPFVSWDFNALKGSKLQSIWGLAGVYYTGQLTSSAIVMRNDFFEE